MQGSEYLGGGGGGGAYVDMEGKYEWINRGGGVQGLAPPLPTPMRMSIARAIAFSLISFCSACSSVIGF